MGERGICKQASESTEEGNSGWDKERIIGKGEKEACTEKNIFSSSSSLHLQLLLLHRLMSQAIFPLVASLSQLAFL